MKVICENLPCDRRACVATIGVFDGIHLGHRKIFARVRQESKIFRVDSLVITFDLPPRVILKQHFPGCITSFEEKKRLIESEGIDRVWFLKSRSALLRLSGREFLRFVQRYVQLKVLVVGEDFRFGFGGRCSVVDLKFLAREFGFKLVVLKKKKQNQKVLSSSLAREFIRRGDFASAGKLLGRGYEFSGKVCRGRGNGEKLGFPTANVDVSGHVIPPPGVYAARVRSGGKKYLAAVNIGVRPTLLRSGRVVLESHLLGFRGNLRGRTISVEFLKRIRGEKKFSSRKVLRQAISRDVEYIRHVFSF